MPEILQSKTGAPVLYRYGIVWESPVMWAATFKDKEKSMRALMRLLGFDKVIDIFIQSL